MVPEGHTAKAMLLPRCQVLSWAWTWHASDSLSESSDGLQENFNQTPSEEGSSDSIPSYLQGAPPDTPVMMYCTGGPAQPHGHALV